MTSSENTDGRTRNRLTLILIAAVFVLPIVVAGLFAGGYFDVSQRHRLNHGTFIAPPLRLEDLPASPATKVLREMAPADWAILFISDAGCDTQCQSLLKELATIRTLVGKEGTRVSVFGLLGEETPNLPSELPRILVDKARVEGIGGRLQQSEPATRLPQVVFLDWRGMIMMRFAPDAPPADIKDDLQRLLRASAIR